MSSSKSTAVAKLSRKRIGKELASNVADYIVSGRTIVNNHRDYCGHGLLYQGGKFYLLECDDYTLYMDVNSDQVLKSWTSKKEFVDFLFNYVILDNT